MSTTVDKKQRAPRLSAAQCRARLLAAAKIAFTRAGYDAVGVREIAGAAGVDPAMISRLFGSKASLFECVARDAFDLDSAFTGPADQFGESVAAHLLGPIRKTPDRRFDEFAFLLRSVGSPEAAPILAAALHDDFVLPLSRRMEGPQAQARAALATAYVLGFAVLRAGLGSPAIDGAPRELVLARLGRAIQDCLEP